MALYSSQRSPEPRRRGAAIYAPDEPLDTAPTIPLFDEDDAWGNVWRDSHGGPPQYEEQLPRRRGGPDKRRTALGVVSILVLVVAAVVAIGPAHLFVHAASTVSIYDDGLAAGWQNWSYQSDVNLANTDPVYAGSHSIAWTPRAGWSTLYLHSQATVDLTGYTALTFTVRASQNGLHYGVELINQDGKPMTSIRPLDDFGGNPTAGSWHTYTIPISPLAPNGGSTTGVALQAWPDAAGSTVYVDKVQLIAGTTPPVPATSKTAVYDDGLAAGWQNWSYQSDVNLANTDPVYAGSHSIAWTPRAGWSTLYLHSQATVDLTGYTALTFAAQASQSGEGIRVGLTDSANRPIGPLATLNAYGGDPVQGSWKVYTIPLTAVAPNATSAYGIALQNWSNSAAPAVYVDSVALIGNATDPGGAPTPVPPMATPPTATPPTATPPASGGGSSAAFPNLPDTTKNIHVALPFDYHVSDPSAENGKVDYVWGSQWANSTSTVYKSFYIQYDLDADTRWYSKAHDLSWWKANHPDWIEYRCDRTTPAWEFNATTAVPLDVTNPAVRNYIQQTFLAPTLSSGSGYQGIGFDNPAFQNAGSWTGQRCGHFNASGQWIQQFNGTKDDPAYRQAIIDWAKDMHTWIHANFPKATMLVNFSYDDTFPQDSYELAKYVDILLDEQGFTHGNNGPGKYTDGVWLRKMQWIQQSLALGHGIISINQEPVNFSSLSVDQVQWALANYLLVKNNASMVYICGHQEYGSIYVRPEYSAQIGSPTGDMTATQNVYMRTFTNGLALVNPSSTASHTVTLSGAHHDLYGHAVGSQVTLPPATGLVLLDG